MSTVLTSGELVSKPSPEQIDVVVGCFEAERVKGEGLFRVVPSILFFFYSFILFFVFFPVAIHFLGEHYTCVFVFLFVEVPAI